MKYLFKTLLILLAVLFGLKFFIHLFDKGHEVSYSSGNFKVKEVLKTNSLYGSDSYYFELSHEKFKMNFQIPTSYNKAEKIINTIKYEKVSNMYCIMPVFKGNKILTDIMCIDLQDKKNKSELLEMKFYRDLSNEKKKDLSGFVKSLKKYGYDVNDYKDSASSHKLSNTITLYDDNIVENHYIAAENYKGLSLYNNKQSNVKLFDNDVYKKSVKIFSDKYYIVADYNEQYSFKNFYVVNIINGKVSKIRSYDDLSFDIVVQGALNDEIYFFDKDSETQYKINLKHETVEKVSDKNDLKYYDGQWGNMTLNEAASGKKFDRYYSDVPNGFVKADCLGNKVGYCYFYKKQNDNLFEVYRADVQNKKMITYLFTTSDMNSVIYLDDYIYFLNNNSIYYYHDKGVRQVLENTELEFNDDLLFGVYIK